MQCPCSCSRNFGAGSCSRAGTSRADRARYLRDQDVWLKTNDVKGTWVSAGDLPESFKKLPDDDNWKEVKASLPGKKVKADKVPRAFVSLTPAELILLQGAPSYL